MNITPREPCIRMDIQTAVQIASLPEARGRRSLGLVELLTESEPVELDPLGGPMVGTLDIMLSKVVTQSTRWRDALAHRARMARQARAHSWPMYDRRRANQVAHALDARLIRVLTWSVWVLSMGVAVSVVKLVIEIARA